MAIFAFEDKFLRFHGGGAQDGWFYAIGGLGGHHKKRGREERHDDGGRLPAAIRCFEVRNTSSQELEIDFLGIHRHLRKMGWGNSCVIGRSDRSPSEHKAPQCGWRRPAGRIILKVSPNSSQASQGGNMFSRIWKYSLAGLLASALVAAPAFSQGNSQGHGKGKGHNKHEDNDD